MVLVRDEAQVEACFGPFGDNCTFCVERAIGSEIVWMHPMELLGDVVMWNLTSFRLGTVLVSVQDR